MKRTTIFATAFSMLGCWGANAEPLRAMQAPPGAMPAYEAVTITRSMGLDPLGGPVWRNGRYVLLATDYDGRELRVVLDGGTGQVIAVRPVAANYFAPGSAPVPGYRGAAYDPNGAGYRGAAYDPSRPVYRPGGYVVREDDDVVVTSPRPNPPAYRGNRSREPVLPPQQMTSRTPATVTPAKPAPVTTIKRKETPAQTAKVTPASSPSSKPDAAVQKHEGAQTAASSATTGSSSAEKKEIRKIEIDKKPADETPSAAKPAAAPSKDDVPVNPLL